MVLANNWHKDQTRTDKKTFQKTWDKETILWITSELEKMTELIDIQVGVVRKYDVVLSTAIRWVEIAHRIMGDMHNGLSYEEAEERDRERRNVLRRSKTAQTPDETHA